jgi:hypothetical protein
MRTALMVVLNHLAAGVESVDYSTEYQEKCARAYFFLFRILDSTPAGGNVDQPIYATCKMVHQWLDKQWELAVDPECALLLHQCRTSLHRVMRGM